MVKVVVVGAGASGLMAAITAAKYGAQVLLLEKNDILGKKLKITGKGRCNITNICELDKFIKNVPGNGVFLYSALAKFNNKDLMNFFKQHGLKLKVERGGRVFPESDNATDVVETFKKILRQYKVSTYIKTKVKEIKISNNKVKSIILSDDKKINSDRIIIATGGLSYPGTGSTGDGIKMANKLNIKVVEPKPALVPLVSLNSWIKTLEGLNLNNIKVSLYKNDKKIDEKFGELLFTDFGLSGPIILTISRKLLNADFNKDKWQINLNLKPALNLQQLEARVIRDFEKFSKKYFKNSLNKLLPLAIIPIFVKLSGINEYKQVSQLTKKERLTIVYLLQSFPIQLKGKRPISESIVTVGGICVKELETQTLMCKKVKGLYFVGETIDVDANTGGYNLQIAFTTGYVAGKDAALNNY